MPLFLCDTIQTADLHTWRIVNGFALIAVKDPSQVAKENLIAFMRKEHNSDALVFPENDEEMNSLAAMAKLGRIVYYSCTERAQLLANLNAQKQGKKAADEIKETKKAPEQKTATLDDPFAEVQKAIEVALQKTQAKEAEEVSYCVSRILKEKNNPVKVL